MLGRKVGRNSIEEGRGAFLVGHWKDGVYFKCSGKPWRILGEKEPFSDLSFKESTDS